MNATNLLLGTEPDARKDWRSIRHILMLVLISSLAIISSRLMAQNMADKSVYIAPTDLLIKKDNGTNGPKRITKVLYKDTSRQILNDRNTSRLKIDSLISLTNGQIINQSSKIRSPTLFANNLISPKSISAEVQVGIRLKKYGLALKLFYVSLLNKYALPTPSWQQTLLDEKGIINMDSLFSGDTLADKKRPKKMASKRISVKKIIRSFKDGKEAVAYGILIHIKQPVAGTRKTFKWFDGVGHCFITLSKYNLDGSIVSCTYGYYPNRSFLLQGTPLLPSAISQYKNDSFHDADETLGRLISARQFHKILRTTKRFALRKYHLNKNNCTDFVLKVANIAGFRIQQTKGRWPLGGGNDPGDLGQSILENKIQCDCGNNFLRYALPDFN